MLHSRSDNRLAGLDTLRAIAIMHVVLAHGTMAFMPEMRGTLGKLLWLLIATNVGVPLFFVLSGFLITRQLARGMPTRVFYRHRLAKIYPMFALAVLVFGVLNGAREPMIWVQHFLALHNTSSEVSSRMAGHFWSLAVEIQFYVLAPLLYAWAYKWLSWRVMACLVLISFCWHAGLLWNSPVAQEARLTVLMDVYQSTSFNIIALLMGALLYRSSSQSQRWRAVPVIGIIAALGMPVICAVVMPSLQVTQVDLTRIGNALALLLLITLPPIACLCLAYLTLQQGWFEGRRWKQGAGFIAAISYQWYLWHPLVLLAFARASNINPRVQQLSVNAPWAMLIAYILISGFVAWAMYRWLEHPVNRWIVKRAPTSGAEPERPLHR